MTVTARWPSVTEGTDGPPEPIVRFIVRADRRPTSNLTVNIALSGAESFIGDSVTLPTTVEITPTTYPRVEIAIEDDEVDEPNATLTLQVQEGDGYTVGDPGSANIRILDDDGPEEPEVTIAAGTSPITEGTSAMYTLTAAPAPAADLIVHIKATGAEDFVPGTPPTMATIPGGATTASVMIDTENDATDEPDADLTVTVQSGMGHGYTVGIPSSAMVTIQDDDDPPVIPAVTIEAGDDSPVTEGMPATFTVRATPAPTAELTVSISATGAGDFVDDHDRPSTVTIGISGTGTVSVATDDDEMDEDNADLTVTVEEGAGYTVGDPSSAMVTIADNDDPALPEVTITAESPITEGEIATYTLTASPAPTTALTVNIKATGADDFVSGTPPDMVTIPAGETTASVTIETEDDAMDEPDADLTVTVEEGTGYTVSDPPPSAMVTIADNDDPAPELPEVTIAAVASSITEGASAMYTLTAEPAPTTDLTVNIEATGADDFVSGTPPDMVTIPASETTASVTIDTEDDAVDEPDAGLTVTVEEGDGYTMGDPSSAVVTIEDDDDSAVPGMPTNVMLTAGDMELDVSWEAPADDGGTAIIDYEVQHAIRGSGDWPADGERVTDTSVTIMDLVNGTAYAVRVRAMNDVGNGPWSETEYETPMAPAPEPEVPGMPMNVMLTAGDTELGVGWEAPADDGGSAIIDYEVQHTIRGSGDWPADGERVSDTSVTITDLMNGTAYAVRVRAMNAVGDGPWSETEYETPMAPAPGGPVVTVEVAPTRTSVTEGAGEDARFIVRLTPLPASALTVNIALSGAESFVDDSALPTTVTFMPGATPVLPRVDIPIIDDDVDEMDGVLTLTVENGAGYTVGDPASAMATIVDDDDPALGDPVVTIEAGDSPVTEGTPATFTVRATRAPTAALTVNLAASGADDLVGTPPTSTVIAAGETSVTVSVATIDDEVDEANGDLTVTLRSGAGYTVGNPSSAVVTINDDDDTASEPAPVVTIVAGNSPVTEGTPATFTVRATRAPTAALTVNLAASGADDLVGTPPTSTVIAAGETSVTVSVGTIDDEVDEANGDLTVTLRSGAGYTVGNPSSAVVTINDDDTTTPEPAPTVTIEAGDSPVTEGMPATFTVRATPAPTAALTVNLAASGADDLVGTLPTSTVIAAGEASVTVSVGTIDDEVDEANGDLTVTLRSGAGYTVGNPSSAVVTINDDDDTAPEPDPTVTITGPGGPVTEGGVAVFTVTATPAPAAALTVNVAATGADSFVEDRPETVTVGTDGTGTVSVATVDDEMDEPDAELTVTLRSGAGYTVGDPSSAMVAINDDDLTPVPALPVLAQLLLAAFLAIGGCRRYLRR